MCTISVASMHTTACSGPTATHLLVAMCVCTACSTTQRGRCSSIEPSLLCFSSMYAWATLTRAGTHICKGSAVYLCCGAAACSHISFTCHTWCPAGQTTHVACLMLGGSVQLMWVHASGTCIYITQQQHVSMHSSRTIRHT